MLLPRTHIWKEERASPDLGLAFVLVKSAALAFQGRDLLFHENARGAI